MRDLKDRTGEVWLYDGEELFVVVDKPEPDGWHPTFILTTGRESGFFEWDDEPEWENFSWHKLKRIA